MNLPKRIFIFFTFPLLISIFGAGVWVGDERGIPFVGRAAVWSLGIYQGRSPFDLQPIPGMAYPSIQSKNVDDVRAGFMADPFLFAFNEQIYLFFEVFDLSQQKGVISVASSSDGKQWQYEQVVLQEDFHLSYPYVFEHQGEMYMLPETGAVDEVRLYHATRFPYEWEFVGALLAGENFLDPSIILWQGNWYIFAETNPHLDDTLRLYTATDLTGPWKEHPASPVVVNQPDHARPGGRIFVYNERLFRFAQDDYPEYGNQVWAMEIVELSPTAYQEKIFGERPVVAASGTGWNEIGMHQVDPLQMPDGSWLAAVDGRRLVWEFGLDH